LSAILRKRLTVQGFIVLDFASQTDDFLRDVGRWIQEGKIKYREDIVTGLERAPDAFIGLLRGKNLGKLLIKIAES
jgi:NADPH-dependent curcumin reductase CurA